MKIKSPFTFLLIAAIGVSSLTACSEKKEENMSEDLREMQAESETDHRINEMRENIRQEREEFLVQARARVEKNKQDIEDLKVVAKEKKGEAKVKYDNAIEELRAENVRIESKMDENKEAADDKWDNFKEEFNSDMDNLGKSIGNLFKDNK